MDVAASCIWRLTCYVSFQFSVAVSITSRYLYTPDVAAVWSASSVQSLVSDWEMLHLHDLMKLRRSDMRRGGFVNSENDGYRRKVSEGWFIRTAHLFSMRRRCSVGRGWWVSCANQKQNELREWTGDMRHKR